MAILHEVQDSTQGYGPSACEGAPEGRSDPDGNSRTPLLRGAKLAGFIPDVGWPLPVSHLLEAGIFAMAHVRNWECFALNLYHDAPTNKKLIQRSWSSNAAQVRQRRRALNRRADNSARFHCASGHAPTRTGSDVLEGRIFWCSVALPHRLDAPTTRAHCVATAPPR